MEIRNAFRSLFAIACSVSAAAVQAVDFPNPAAFNPTWESAKPGTSRSTDLPTGALLGNGSLGAVNGGDGNHKHFVLTRGDLWSCGDLTWGNVDNNARPISFADFSIGPHRGWFRQGTREAGDLRGIYRGPADRDGRL